MELIKIRRARLQLPKVSHNAPCSICRTFRKRFLLIVFWFPEYPRNEFVLQYNVVLWRWLIPIWCKCKACSVAVLHTWGRLLLGSLHKSTFSPFQVIIFLTGYFPRTLVLLAYPAGSLHCCNQQKWLIFAVFGKLFRKASTLFVVVLAVLLYRLHFWELSFRFGYLCQKIFSGLPGSLNWWRECVQHVGHTLLGTSPNTLWQISVDFNRLLDK